MSTIVIKNSSTPGNQPASLNEGELAINTSDGKIFYGSTGGVKEFAGGGGGGTTPTGSLLTTASAAGNTITFTKGDGTTFPVTVSGGSGTPGGSNTQIQFNGNGAFSGSSALTFDSGSNRLTLTGSFNMSGSNVFIGSQTVTGSLSTSGSNTLIGNTILSGSIRISGSSTIQGTTTMTGSLNITGSTTQTGNNTLIGNTLLTGSIIISGSNPPGSITASVQIYGDIRQSGYHRFDPVTTNIDTSISASYIYVSGSTQDLYFSQNSSGYNNVTRLRWLEGNLYTGLLHGGLISASVGGTTFNLSSGSGIIVNLNASLTQDPYPTIKFVNWGNFTNQTINNRTTDIQTYIGIDSNGQIIQQTVPWNDGQYNESISIGTVIHQNLSTVNATITYPNVAYGYKQRTYDFIKAFGPLKLSGYALNTSSSLGLTVGSGSAFADGRNYQTDPNNPSYILDNGTAVSKIFRYYQSGSSFVQDTNAGAGYPGIDTTQYNPGGSGSLAGVSGGKYYVKRIFWYPNSATKGIVSYYGLAEYNSLDEAQANYQQEPFLETPNTQQNAIYLGIILIRGNSDFTNPSNYRILRSSLFRAAGTGGGTGGGGGGATTLGALTDVQLGTELDKQSLVYDLGSSKWINTYSLSGSLAGTASWATNFVSASNYVLNSATSSFVTNSQTSSFTTTSSFNSFTQSINTATSSFVTNNQTSSFVLNSQTSSMLAPYVLNSRTSSFATTGSNTFNGNQIITGSFTVITGSSIELQVTDIGVKIGNTINDIHTVTGSLNVTGSGTIIGTLAIGTSSLGPNENTLTLGARDTANEGGQLGFNAPGGTYTSASFLDLYQNRFRLLRGTNAGSTGEVATWNLGTLQMTLPAYTSPTSFTGTVAAVLGVDTSGNVVTAPDWQNYFGTSTIRGFSSYVAGGNNLQYQIVGKTMYVQFDLRSATNAGSGSATNFTIPNNASAWAGTQVGMCRTQNTTTQNVGMYQIAAGSNQVNFYVTSNNGTLNSWTDAGTRHIQGFAVINIA
jgi:hypothetical protein